MIKQCLREIDKDTVEVLLTKQMSKKTFREELLIDYLKKAVSEGRKFGDGIIVDPDFDLIKVGKEVPEAASWIFDQMSVQRDLKAGNALK